MSKEMLFNFGFEGKSLCSLYDARAMQQIRELISRTALVLLCASGAACSGTTTLESSKDGSQANPLDDHETALLHAIVAYRAKNGVGALVDCTSLNTSASIHADDMRDHSYLSDTAPNGSGVRSRACSAGYSAGCSGNVAMAELVSSGLNDPDAVLNQWSSDPKTNAILLNGALIVAGVGQSFGAAPPIWSVDFGGVNEVSCK
jgi:uncharacterized protein YkwD